MKFGKTFANHRIPEWSSQYVGYKSLKKMIKEITRLQEDIYRAHNKNSYDESRPPTKMRDSSNSAQNYLDSPKSKSYWRRFSLQLTGILRRLIHFTIPSMRNIRKDLRDCFLLINSMR